MQDCGHTNIKMPDTQLDKYQDGRQDMLALQAQYAGEGNMTRRIGKANQTQQLLHYRT